MTERAAVFETEREGGAPIAAAERGAAPVAAAERGVREVAVVCSGKGGVGKSVLAILLAARMAKEGRRVLLLDASEHPGDLNVLLGVPPAANVEALASGDVPPEDLLVEVRENFWFLPACPAAESLYALSPIDRARLHLRTTALYEGFDAVIVDAGSGIAGPLRATIGATRLVVVATPEPAALSDAYALIKIASLRASFLPVTVLVNRSAGQEDGLAAFERLRVAAHFFLKREIAYLGALTESEALKRAVRRPGALLETSGTDAGGAGASEVAEACGRLLSQPAVLDGTSRTGRA